MVQYGDTTLLQLYLGGDILNQFMYDKIQNQLHIWTCFSIDSINNHTFYTTSRRAVEFSESHVDCFSQPD